MSINESKYTTVEATFRNMYGQHCERLLASVAGMVKDENKAENITAAVFRITWEKRAQFRGEFVALHLALRDRLQ